MCRSCKDKCCYCKRKKPLSSSTDNYPVYENTKNQACDPKQPDNQISVDMETPNETNIQDTDNLKQEAKISPNQILKNPVGSYDTNQPCLIPQRPAQTNIVNQPQPYTNNYYTNFNTDNQPTIYNQSMNNVRPNEFGEPVVNNLNEMNGQNYNYPAPPEN